MHSQSEIATAPDAYEDESCSCPTCSGTCTVHDMPDGGIEFVALETRLEQMLHDLELHAAAMYEMRMHECDIAAIHGGGNVMIDHYTKEMLRSWRESRNAGEPTVDALARMIGRLTVLLEEAKHKAADAVDITEEGEA